MTEEEQLALALLRLKLLAVRFDLAESSHRVQRELDEVTDVLAQTPSTSGGDGTGPTAIEKIAMQDQMVSNGAFSINVKKDEIEVTKTPGGMNFIAGSFAAWVSDADNPLSYEEWRAAAKKDSPLGRDFLPPETRLKEIQK